ncbi:cop9 signalosome complex subunit 6a-like protein [Chrysochromulina tobinii]|jgi:COP9 signalosome complex subunit 6|uniref:COP9 signalosome complex subunit 6 n=1 Tax=Chrysochromulina tobinii TaxID=1460289 RepID=A0A0M0K7P0_9EUKA|nr:cop9 signalosome complex subunit 6a-like protein [Chrysochromulina tobinii]|eukprot:KOO34602.1 cop9 signalosome complex subunit 6a-like protein [Chrysochromulina sp. CCMP291]
MAATDEMAALGLTLHPLVVINISDHFTRARCQTGGTGVLPRVFGILIGEQTGRRVEVANSFETKVVPNASGRTVPELAYVRTRLEQYLKTFPKYEMIGWYSTAKGVQEGDLEIHQSLCEISDSLLYLTLDPYLALSGSARELPITIFESQMHVVDGQPTTTFAPAAYKIESIESERIAIDHVAHILPTGEGTSGSAFAQSLGTQYTAMSMLTERVEMLQKYVAAVQAGTVPGDHQLLRQIKAICSRLPALDTKRFHDESLRDFHNTLLVAYLGCITKGTGLVNDVVEKYNVAYDKHSRRRGIF